jgi:DNA-binding MarR family transcriptional regulator
MSSRREIIVKLTEEQRKEIHEKLDKEVTHVKLSLAPGAVIFAEALKYMKDRECQS